MDLYIILTVMSAVWFWRTANNNNQSKWVWVIVGVASITIPTFLFLRIANFFARHFLLPREHVPWFIALLLLAGAIAIAIISGITARRVLLKNVERENERRVTHTQKTCMSCRAVIESWAHICPECSSERFEWK